MALGAQGVGIEAARFAPTSASNFAHRLRMASPTDA
jgi:hypothetical protein